jgi:hypothetical protein
MLPLLVEYIELNVRFYISWINSNNIQVHFGDLRYIVVSNPSHLLWTNALNPHADIQLSISRLFEPLSQNEVDLRLKKWSPWHPKANLPRDSTAIRPRWRARKTYMSPRRILGNGAESQRFDIRDSGSIKMMKTNGRKIILNFYINCYFSGAVASESNCTLLGCSDTFSESFSRTVGPIRTLGAWCVTFELIEKKTV